MTEQCPTYSYLRISQQLKLPPLLCQDIYFVGTNQRRGENLPAAGVLCKSYRGRGHERRGYRKLCQSTLLGGSLKLAPLAVQYDPVRLVNFSLTYKGGWFFLIADNFIP
jgi:hypothetical protein